MHSLSTQELIDLAAQENPAAVAALVERLYPGVLAFLYRRSGDWHLARDLTQDVFLVFLLRRPFRDPRYNREATLRGWLRTVANRRWIHHVRDARRQWQNLGQEQLDEIVDHEPDITNQVEQPEMLARLRIHIEGLPPEYRPVVRRRVFDGVAYEALSVELGVAAETLRWRAFRARQLLRQSIESDAELLAWITDGGWNTASE